MYEMYDYHLHSTHSGDGKVPDIVQAMAAIERGVKEICFTDHFDVDFPNAHNLDFEVDIPHIERTYTLCRNNLRTSWP